MPIMGPKRLGLMQDYNSVQHLSLIVIFSLLGRGCGLHLLEVEDEQATAG